MKKRLAVLMSHPIQYQVPLLRKLSAREDIDLTVYFFWDFGVKETKDPEFGKGVKWDIPILEGYKYKFIENYAKEPSSSFWGQLCPGIVPELVKNKYDAVLAYGWNSLPNWLAFMTAPFVGTKIILAGESPLSQEIKKSKLILLIKRIVLGLLFKLASAIMYIGKENKKFYEFYGVPDEKLFFMPYAVENERFIKEKSDLGSKREQFRAELNIAKEVAVILFVGKLFPKKRPADLLAACASLDMPKDKWALVFVGDGESREMLSEYAKEKELDNVYFAGFQNQTKLAKYYILSDLFVLPSGAGETWGLVVNEAMCFGLPVIISDVVGCGADLVRQGENGFIFPLGDIKELSDKILSLAADPEKRKKFGIRSFEIISGYTQDEDVRGLEKALAKITGK